MITLISVVMVDDFFVVRVDTESGIWILMVIAVDKWLVSVINSAILSHIRRAFNRVLLDLLNLASVVLPLFLYFVSKLAPLTEETCHVLHPVVSVEQGCHSIE